MFDEQRQARERLGAAVAGVLLELGVRLQVRAQVGPVGEGSAALRTGERAFARVRAKMSLEQPRPRERLAAQLAPTRQRVCPDVHLQRAERGVRLAAVPARQLPVTTHGGRSTARRRHRRSTRRRRWWSFLAGATCRTPMDGGIPRPVSVRR